MLGRAAPVGGLVELGLGMHGTAAELHLERSIRRGQNAHMQRTISVPFWATELVIKLLMYQVSQAMYYTQHPKTIGVQVDDDTQHCQVMNLSLPS